MIRYGFASLILFFAVATVVSAQSESFTISTNILAADTATPTAPVGLTAVAETPTQARLEWGAATDDIGVTGYQVWRDGAQIATTSLLNYVDSPVLASTTYEYYVIAFDASGKFSASSTAVSLTMPPEVVVATSTESAGGSGGFRNSGLIIDNIEAQSTQSTIELSFITSEFARAQVIYQAVSGGVSFTVQGDQAQKNHSVVLTDLEPGTQYSITIEASRSIFTAPQTKTVLVRTKGLPDESAPPNVRNFTATPGSTGISLTWDNPVIPDFARVRIVRNEQFFPSDVADGWVVYEGTGTSWLDSDTLPGDARYYTIYVYDTAGNRSSGAVALVRVRTGSESDGDTEVLIEPEVIPAPNWSLEIEVLQGDEVSTQNDTNIFTLPQAAPFTVRIPAASLPPELKTIVVTVTSATDSLATFSFLLRRTADGNYYEAHIDTLPVVGTYPIEINWYTFADKQAYQWQGELQVQQAPVADAAPEREWPWWILLVIIGLYVLWRIIRRTK